MPKWSLSSADARTQLEAAFGGKPTQAQLALATSVLTEWPWAARETTATYLAALLFLALHQGAALAALLPKLRRKKPLGPNAAVLAWRAAAFDAAEAYLSRPARQPPVGDEDVPALPIGSPTKVQAPWLALADKKQGLSALLAALPYGPGTHLGLRCAVLAGFPRDPRISAAVSALALAAPVRSETDQPLWPALVFCLGAHADGAATAALQTLARQQPTFLSAAHFVDALARGTPTAPSAPEKPKSKGAPSSEAGWIAFCAAAPEELERRRLFADWLSGRDDPRGEFITLQLAALKAPLTPAQAKREQQLLKKHGAQWAAPFARFRRKGTEVFRGGFVVGLVGSAPNAGSVPDPAVAPVQLLEELDLDFDTTFVPALGALLEGPHLDGLLRLGGLAGRAILPALGRARPKLRALGFAVSGPSVQPDALAKAFAAATLPALEVLQLHGHRGAPADLSRFFTAPAFARVRELYVDRHAPIAQWRAQADALPGLQTLHLLPYAATTWGRPSTTIDRGSEPANQVTLRRAGTTWDVERVTTAGRPAVDAEVAGLPRGAYGRLSP
ncbi:MAG: hypothetical protein K1X89_02180 [Myxococcaceae bacterium]|nr:hypothetical protein [Myxococcaceae bacterium]